MCGLLYSVCCASAYDHDLSQTYIISLRIYIYVLIRCAYNYRTINRNSY